MCQSSAEAWQDRNCEGASAKDQQISEVIMSQAFREACLVRLQRTIASVVLPIRWRRLKSQE